MAEKVRVGLAIESQDAAAINNLIKFAKAQDKVGDSTKRVNREARDQSTQVDGLKGAWAKALTTMSGIVSIGTLVAGAKDAIGELIETWEKNQAAVEANIGALTRFSAISTLSAADREMIFENIGHLDVGQAAHIAFSARSALFEEDEIKEVLKEASQAKQLGEDPEKFSRSLIALRQGVFGDRSVSQVSNFLATMAEKSPLSADTYAEQFTKVGGIAGATDEEKAAGGALMSALIKSMGADVSPEVASTAAKGFLVKRKTVGSEFLAGLGMEGWSVPDQIAGLAEIVQSPDWERPQQITTEAGTTITTLEKQFLEAFGERTAPALASLLRSPEALKRIAPDTAAGVEALNTAGPSMLARKVDTLSAQDPVWAQEQETQEIRARRAAGPTRRGFEQSAEALARERLGEELENEWLPLYGEAGSVRTGALARVVKSNVMSPADPLTGTLQKLGQEIGKFYTAVMENREALEKSTRDLKGSLDENTRSVSGGAAKVVDTGGTVE